MAIKELLINSKLNNKVIKKIFNIKLLNNLRNINYMKKF